jgi:hypothetical protein
VAAGKRAAVADVAAACTSPALGLATQKALLDASSPEYFRDEDLYGVSCFPMQRHTASRKWIFTEAACHEVTRQRRTGARNDSFHPCITSQTIGLQSNQYIGAIR